MTSEGIRPVRKIDRELRLWTATLAAVFFAAANLVFAAEKSAHVISVGTCWTGYNAVVVTMDNGDQLTLGNLDDALTKARMSAALVAKASGDAVWYQIYATNVVCSINRGSVEWWSVGGSLF